MVEDNKIAVLCLVAGVEVGEELHDEKRVENYADGAEPLFSLAVVHVVVECIRERSEQKHRIKHNRHDGVPIKPISNRGEHVNCVPNHSRRKFMEHLLELAVRMNYVPVITAHVTYNFLVNGIGRRKLLLS